MSNYQGNRWEVSDWLLAGMSDDEGESDDRRYPELAPYNQGETDAEIDAVFSAWTSGSARSSRSR